MKTIFIFLCFFVCLGLSVRAQSSPPPEAFKDCSGKLVGAIVEHKTREGKVEAVCEQTPEGLVARPKRRDQLKSEDLKSDSKNYTLEQAMSDNAQLKTIAFDGLSFLTGDFSLDTFLPPGKVSDYFGFQNMRDIDDASGGHSTNFLTKIANNMLSILTDAQKVQLLNLAKNQESSIRLFAEKRFPLIKAFRQNLKGDVPAKSLGLSKSGIMKYSAELYALDGEIAFERAKVMGTIIKSFNSSQKELLAKLKFGSSKTWPELPDQLDKKSMSHEIDVAMMTYASEMFSWYAGNLEADTYFCPERHGMYFGGFGMKTAPAMGKKNYSISTSLTGDSGEAFLNTLDSKQKKTITDIVELQRAALGEIIKTRRAISTELRRFMTGEIADKAKIIALSKRYGELDGELSFYYARAFGEVGKSLTTSQKEKLNSLRSSNPSDPKGPFLYSTPISMPKVESTNFLFEF
jgi:hypothetical protein